MSFTVYIPQIDLVITEPDRDALIAALAAERTARPGGMYPWDVIVCVDADGQESAMTDYGASLRFCFLWAGYEGGGPGNTISLGSGDGNRGPARVVARAMNRDDLVARDRDNAVAAKRWPQDTRFEPCTGWNRLEEFAN